MAILVAGGAGYIGSHTCVELLNAGYEVVVVDNLYNSSEEALKRVEQITGKTVKFYEADVLDREALEKIFDAEDIDSVINFAGLKAVCQEYLEAQGTGKEKEAAEKLSAALKDCVQSIDTVIPFFKSEAGVKYFGKETAAALAKAADEAQEKGSKYCICPACTAGGYLLDHIHEL